MNDIALRRSWVEISLKKLSDNLKIFCSWIGEKSEVMVVVKADAYGHGVKVISEFLQQCGICNFAVSNLNEAIELRKNGIKGQILILGYTPIDQMDKVISYELTQTIISEEYADDIISTGHKIKCQYAIDTGMNRIGINADERKRCEKVIRKAYSNLILTGLFSHLCVADDFSQELFTKSQIHKFLEIVDTVRDLDLPFIHILNSAGGLFYQENVGNLVRLGIVLYGLKPNYSNLLPEGILPVLQWKSIIAMVKDVYPGESIGYGRSCIIQTKKRIATIPTGYADGYRRDLSDKGYVLINGKIAPIMGKICMDQFMVDITDIPDAKIYDEVILLGESQKKCFSADDMGKMLGTIGYEIVCGIGKRVPRIYV